MSQIMEESNCGNKRFYKCIVEENQCVNCEKFFGMVGEKVKNITCTECGKKSKVGIVVVKHGNGFIAARCEKCDGIEKNVSELYSEFVGESIYFDLVGRPVPNQVVSSRLNALVSRIAGLPKEELQKFLADVHGAIER